MQYLAVDKAAWHKLDVVSIYKFYTKPSENDMNTYMREIGVSYCDLTDDKTGHHILSTLEDAEEVMHTIACRITYKLQHDDIIKWKHFPRYWPFVRGIRRWPVNSSHKCQ